MAWESEAAEASALPVEAARPVDRGLTLQDLIHDLPVRALLDREKKQQSTRTWIGHLPPSSAAYLLQ